MNINTWYKVYTAEYKNVTSVQCKMASARHSALAASLEATQTAALALLEATQTATLTSLEATQTAMSVSLESYLYSRMMSLVRHRWDWSVQKDLHQRHWSLHRVSSLSRAWRQLPQRPAHPHQNNCSKQYRFIPRIKENKKNYYHIHDVRPNSRIKIDSY